MTHNPEIGYLYINGLTNGETKRHEQLAQWWWRRAGLELNHAHLDWFSGSLEDKVNEVELKSRALLEKFGKAALIGSSAGVSLALNSYFDRLKDENVCVVLTHGRVRTGDYAETDKNSMSSRAGLDTHSPSQAFYDSVTRAEQEVLPNLSDEQKERILQLTQLTDLVAPIDTCLIEGVQTHRSITFGHGGGFMAHLLADRDMIARFAEEQLASN